MFGRGGRANAVVDVFRLRGIVGVVVKSMLPVRPSKPRAASVASFTIVIAWGTVSMATTTEINKRKGKRKEKDDVKVGE